MSTITFQHPDLGEIIGKVHDGTVQFRGLKYASLRDRLAPPQLVTSYGSGLTDATNYGPPPVSPPDAVKTEFFFLQQSLPLPEVPAQSDLEGLNLNITLPLNAEGSFNTKSKLPVYVYIHGGGFVAGSSWFPHYDPAAIVKLSQEKGKPIIGITINYRLGVTGFLTSEELRKAGYKANNGFHDQRTAFKWVRKFISGFGGNPDEITAAGESVGGLSATALLLSNEPLMKRCLSTGGAILLWPPVTPAVAELAYQQVIEAFDLVKKSPEDRIKALLSLPAEELWKKVPLETPLLPATDEDTYPGDPTFLNVASKEDDPTFLIPGRKWCSALMIGECKLDANILAFTHFDARNPGIAGKFIDSMNKSLASHPEAASLLFSSYNITLSTSDEEAVSSILRFATDINFYVPAISFAKGWPQTKDNKFFLYHFNEGIPWEGRFKGDAGHVLDAAFLFQNFNGSLSDEPKAVARAYAEDFIEFVSGNDPWPPVEGDRLGARVYGPSSEGITAKYIASGTPEEVGRSDLVLKIGELAGFDLLSKAFHKFFRGQ